MSMFIIWEVGSGGNVEESVTWIHHIKRGSGLCDPNLAVKVSIKTLADGKKQLRTFLRLFVS